MLVKINSAAVFGLEAFLVEVEVDQSKNMPGQTIVGLPDAAVKESRDRVRAAIKNSGYEFPPGYFTINLAPAAIKKIGPLYDLPIAIGILTAGGVIEKNNLEGVMVFGELSLDGGVKPVAGVLAMCTQAKECGKKTVLVPEENAAEAALVTGPKIIPVKSLSQAIDFLNKKVVIDPFTVDLKALMQEEENYELDFSEVKGQQHAKRALEIAAAGGHNVILVGSPGSGKTMLARRFPTILPPLEIGEALEITRLYSVSGLLSGKEALIKKRPFRSPHHTTSDIGMVGGGRIPRPGEISLAHLGILFLDEFPEFERNVLEVLRQPLEDSVVTISRALSSLTFPAEFMLVAAMNPCPCGNYGDPLKECICPPFKVQRYWQKLSGPLLDRIDLQVEVPRLKKEELGNFSDGESSAVIKRRVVQARQIQQERFSGSRVRCNAKMKGRQIKDFCTLDKEASDLLKSAILHLKMTGRSYDRILKVGRTIADLGSSAEIKAAHIAEATQYRVLDREGSAGRP